MKLFDRYTNTTLFEKDLPNHIDFGRYCFADDRRDITYANFQTNKTIKQDLLLDKNKSIQDILIDIGIDVEKSGDGKFNIIPLIRRIKNKLGLNDFERLLLDKLFHLEEIFRAPHYLLHREIEKVHTSKAKRIPSKSYQYLASHTEDWVHKSIFSFKPSRILHEELYLNFDIYENQLIITFLQRCLVYLNSRLIEIQDLKDFFSKYERLLKDRNDQKGWYKKINRNLSLIGAVYEDEHYHGREKDGAFLSKTEEILNQLYKRLLLLQKSELFESVNKRATQSIVLKNTNVLINHKHYRYLKSLWIELDKIKPEKSDAEKLKYEQDVIKGLREYAKSIITYTLNNTLDYICNGNYQSFKGKHISLSSIEFDESASGIFKLRIGNYKLNIIIIANTPTNKSDLRKILHKTNSFIFFLSEEEGSKADLRFTRINPIDPNSIERVGTLIKAFLLHTYVLNLNREHNFQQLLKDYVKHIPTEYIIFDNHNFTFKFHSYPKSVLKEVEVIERLQTDPLFTKISKKSRPKRENIIKNMSVLINKVNEKSNELKTKFLHCFNCSDLLPQYANDQLNYIRCPKCNAVVDSTSQEKIIFQIDDERYNELTSDEFGMDNISFDPKTILNS